MPYKYPFSKILEGTTNNMSCVIKRLIGMSKPLANNKLKPSTCKSTVARPSSRKSAIRAGAASPRRKPFPFPAGRARSKRLGTPACCLCSLSSPLSLSLSLHSSSPVLRWTMSSSTDQRADLSSGASPWARWRLTLAVAASTAPSRTFHRCHPSSTCRTCTLR